MQPASLQFQSRRKAMDASLVLLSQGIHSTIEMPGEELDWHLVIDPNDHARAVEILALHHTENPARPWSDPLPFTRLLFDWRGLAWFGLLTVIFVLDETRFAGMRPAGRMDSQAVLNGEWWRLFTAVCLHADLHHLLANVTTGLVLLGLAMAAFGSGHALLTTFLAGAGANVAGFLIYPLPHYGLGASGMVMAALGLLTAQSLGHLRAGLAARQFVLRGLCGGALLLAILGFNPESDIIAHLAGFVLGFIFGGAMSLLTPNLHHHEPSNRITELLTGILLALTWFLALR